MTITNKIEFARLEELHLDPRNPRLGRENVARKLQQSEVLELMQDWNLEELALSFIEGGFWVQEALLVVRERVGRSDGLVVIEGNRRLAALQLLKAATSGTKVDARWKALIADKRPPAELFTRIPYLLAGSREDIESFLGFRHVTGIAQWHPAEKAEFIAKLIEERKLSYEEVMRKIGSKTPAVRQNYIAFNLLRQMEDTGDVAVEHVERKFSVLFLSLRTEGVRNYLELDMNAEPKVARHPVRKANLPKLKKLALWLFGDDRRPPVLPDSRQIDDFGRVLQSAEGIAYLERSPNPRLDIALQQSGVAEEDLVRLINVAADNVEQALMRAHLHRSSRPLQVGVERLGAGLDQLRRLFSTPSTGGGTKAPKRASRGG